LAKDKAYAQIHLDEISIHQVISFDYFELYLHAVVCTFLQWSEPIRSSVHESPFVKQEIPSTKSGEDK
jgi:hypothetical protein